MADDPYNLKGPARLLKLLQSSPSLVFAHGTRRGFWCLACLAVCSAQESRKHTDDIKQLSADMEIRMVKERFSFMAPIGS